MSSKNRKVKSLVGDKYYTPQYAIDLMMDRINFSKVKSFLEPCVGDSRILKSVPKDVIKYYCEIDLGIDYLKTDCAKVDLIVTNPPFSMSIEFITKSLQESDTVCYLQRLNWLGSETRKNFWNSNPPDKILVLSKRPQFMKEMGLKSGTDSTEYAWFVWDKMNIVRGNYIEVL